MKPISIADDIVPIAEFKSSISAWFKKLRNHGHPLIITQNGKPAGVLLSPQDYDELVYKKSFLESVERGVSDANSGRIYRTEEIRALMASVRNKD